jgi:AbrB family looped-hinge helix DNA binding protein
MAQEEKFVAQVIGSGRVTIPDTVRELLTIKEGDFVEVRIRKRGA